MTKYSLIKKHPVIGAEILKDVTLLPHVLEVTRGHHERYDGNGYPDGLAGKRDSLFTHGSLPWLTAMTL